MRLRCACAQIALSLLLCLGMARTRGLPLPLRPACAYTGAEVRAVEHLPPAFPAITEGSAPEEAAAPLPEELLFAPQPQCPRVLPECRPLPRRARRSVPPALHRYLRNVIARQTVK